jgi:NodT family efflux transporter outer membrane factor (OMF) lipoprotein
VGAVATWEVDVFGRLRRQLGARSALVGAAAADREAVRIGLTAEIASTYFTVRELQLRLRVARDNAENQRRTLELTEQRLEAGRGTAFDVRRARAQFAATTATIPGLEADGAAVSAALAALAGQVPGTFDSLLAPGGSLPVPDSTLGAGTPASLLARRPDVRSAERTVAAARASAGAATAGLLPRLTLGAELGSTSLESDGLLKSGNGRYAVGPVLSWPVLSLGRLFADRDAAAAQRDQAEAAYRAATLFALQETEAALRRYRGSSEALVSLEAAAAASAEATGLATLRYQEGVTDFLQVLDAQRTQLESEDRLVRGRGDFSRALVELYRSLAGDGFVEDR